jgi:hypothetical protein
LDPALGLRGAHKLAEQIGIATQVLGRRERDRIDPIYTATWPAAGNLPIG